MEWDETQDINKWRSINHVENYLPMMVNVPHNEEIEKVFLEQIPLNVNNVLDLGTGDGRLLDLVNQKNLQAKELALGFSDPMLELAKKDSRKTVPS